MINTNNIDPKIYDLFMQKGLAIEQMEIISDQPRPVGLSEGGLWLKFEPSLKVKVNFTCIRVTPTEPRYKHTRHHD